MNLEIKLFSIFSEGRGKKINIEVEKTTNLTNIIESLNINKEDVSIIMLNGEKVNFEKRIKK